jgi:LysM repeat protein
MLEERDPEKKDRIQQIAWWVQHAFVPIAVAIIAGLSAVTAAALLKPIPSAASIAPTPAVIETQAPASNPAPTVVPAASNTPLPAETETASPTPAATQISPAEVKVLGEHVVRPGEYLYCIARTYGVLPSAIAQANQLGPHSSIHVGQVLEIPAVKWQTIPAGQACAAQFHSRFARAVASLPNSAPQKPPAAKPVGQAATDTPVTPAETAAPTTAPEPTKPVEPSSTEVYVTPIGGVVK